MVRLELVELEEQLDQILLFPVLPQLTAAAVLVMETLAQLLVFLEAQAVAVVVKLALHRVALEQ